MLESLKMAFFVVILDSKYSKICEEEVTLTPLINKICKPCTSPTAKSTSPQAIGHDFLCTLILCTAVVASTTKIQLSNNTFINEIFGGYAKPGLTVKCPLLPTLENNSPR